ncbi:Ig-like domain-containing protein [Marinobacter sp.]|uniref:Ig-like domain-containing protein n=1 Tax=Marinobacter sp. TaxID=50741 RepID=UPI0034A34726
MNYKNTLALLPIAILAACGGDEQTINEPRTPGSVVYSYPSDGQGELSPKTDLVLRFSHALADEDVESKIRVTAGDDTVAFTTEPVDNNRSLRILLEGELEPGADYTIEFTEGLLAEGNRIIATPNAVGAEGIQFSTRAAFSGIAGLDNLSDRFAVDEMIPSPNGVFRPMNFSTFRLRLTQPIHPEWKELGGVIEITDSGGEAVPATVLVKGRYVTIDPCIGDSPELCGREDDTLTAGETYTVSLHGLPGLNGGTLESFSEEVTPRDTSPTVVLFQEVIDSGLNAGSSGEELRRSRLNGEIINGVTLNSVLQGTAGPSQQTGGLFAELAFAPSFDADEPLPLRVPKGSVLNSSSLDVRINGLVPVIDPATGSIQETGNIKVTMLSDATGYLLPNPYTDDANAPRHVKLFMDVSMNTEEAQPNASLSQDLLGVELSGIAIVEDGVLTIDAIGMVEPNLLGQEFTDSTIAFRIEAATDSDSQETAASQRDDDLQDLTGPQLVSWMPGPEDAFPATRQDMQRPGDPVVLNFDEPLDADSVAGGVTLDKDGTPLTVADGTLNAKVDGTVLVLNPEGGLEHGVEYAVNINGVTDIAGNTATVPTLTFRLPEISDGTEMPPASPLALTTYPGYPCVTENLDISNGNHGTCVDSPDAPANIERDQLPVTTLPKDRPIVVKFSQSMDLATINDTSFVVEKVADPSAPAAIGEEEDVPGRLEKKNQQIRFYPAKAWELDATYRYTMKSAVDGNCGSREIICSSEQMPLQTDLLVDPSDTGGPNLTIYFTGSESVLSVFTPLRNLPVRDTNSNYVIDCDAPGSTDCLEPFNHEVSDADGFAPSANAAKLVSISNNSTVGCDVDEDCPHNKFIYQTYALNSEVVGPAVDPETGEQGVRVLLYPTMLATTSIDVYLNEGKSTTNTQILRMRYAKDDPECTGSACARNSLIPGIIIESEEGGPIFKTEGAVELFLDAPNLDAPFNAAHNLYSYPFELVLKGPVKFFDDGRMQIIQHNTNVPTIQVEAIAIGLINVTTTLVIPERGIFLNFLSNPIKEIPEEY